MEEVTWEGATNLRHLTGVVWRMGLPERITAYGWEQLQAAGVTTLVDLRNADERGQRQPGWGGVDAPPGVQILHRPIEDQTHVEFMELCGAILDDPAYYRHNLRIFPQQVCRAVLAIGEAESGVVLHCAAGRDRTGLVSAMLLTLAGATRQQILADYAAGARGYNDSLIDHPHPREGHLDQQAMDVRLRPRLATLSDLLDGLDVEEFLLSAGARAAELDAVREKLRRRHSTMIN